MSKDEQTEQVTRDPQVGTGRVTSRLRPGFDSVSDRCSICRRHNIKVKSYSFNAPKEIIDWNSDTLISENPNALTIVICGTDLNLIARIKREGGSRMSPQQILDKAIEYRKMKPIRTV